MQITGGAFELVLGDPPPPGVWARIAQRTGNALELDELVASFVERQAVRVGCHRRNNRQLASKPTVNAVTKISTPRSPLTPTQWLPGS